MVLQVIPKDTGHPDPYKRLICFQTRIGSILVGNNEKIVFVNDNSVWLADVGGAFIEQSGWGWGPNGDRPNPDFVNSFSLWLGQKHPSSDGIVRSDVVIVQDYKEDPASGTTYKRAYTYGNISRSGVLSRAITYVDPQVTGLASVSSTDGRNFYNSVFATVGDDQSVGFTHHPEVYETIGGVGRRPWSGGWNPLRESQFRTYGSMLSRAVSPDERLLSDDVYIVGVGVGSDNPAIGRIYPRVNGRFDQPSTFPQVQYAIQSGSSLNTRSVSGLYYNSRIWTVAWERTTSRSPRILVTHINEELSDPTSYRRQLSGGVSGSSYLLDADVSFFGLYGTSLVGSGNRIFVIVLGYRNDSGQGVDFGLYSAEIFLDTDNVAHWLGEDREPAENPYWSYIEPLDFSLIYKSAGNIDIDQPMNVIQDPSRRFIAISLDCTDGNYRVHQSFIGGEPGPDAPRITSPESGVKDRKKDLTIAWDPFHPEGRPHTAYQIRNTTNGEYLNSQGAWTESEVFVPSDERMAVLKGSSASPWSDKNGEVLTISVRVRDNENIWSDWSNAVSITSSEIGRASVFAVADKTSTIRWFTPGASAQTHYRVQLELDGEVAGDTGWVESSAKSVDVPVENKTYKIIVWWQNSEGLRDESTDGINTRNQKFNVPQPVINHQGVVWQKIDGSKVTPDSKGFARGAAIAEIDLRFAFPDGRKIDLYRRRSDEDPENSPREFVGSVQTVNNKADDRFIKIQDFRLGTKRLYQWQADLIGPPGTTYLHRTSWFPGPQPIYEWEDWVEPRFQGIVDRFATGIARFRSSPVGSLFYSIGDRRLYVSTQNRGQPVEWNEDRLVVGFNRDLITQEAARDSEAPVGTIIYASELNKMRRVKKITIP